MIHQTEIILPDLGRGYHLVTRHIEQALPELPRTGLCHLLLMHTSAGLTLNENADPTVRDDFESFMNRLVPDNPSLFTHTMEGADDMPAHIKSALTGQSLVIPISGGRLKLGTWQGIYLCEFRNHGGRRKIMVTTMGE